MKKRPLDISSAGLLSMAAGLCCLAAIIACRCSRQLADFYSTALYPHISAILSWIASAAPFSLQDITIAVIIAAFILIIVRGARKGRGWWRTSVRVLNLAIWVYVWVHAGWSLNYCRSGILARTGAQRAAFDKESFCEFLERFTCGLNDSWTDSPVPGREEIIAETKAFFESVPVEYGLCRPKAWQQPKPMNFHRLYSSMGVQGYIGPFFDESHINPDLLEEEYPSVYAHEYSHLLGVSSEAEANWWAFQACTHSAYGAVRYSAYLSMLQHIRANAARILSEEEFHDWTESIRPEVKDDYENVRKHWSSMISMPLARVQNKIYDMFLKSNSIPSGVMNYSEVVGLLMVLEL